MARRWAEVGFGAPVALHRFYVVKIPAYVLGAWLVVLTTRGVDGFTTSHSGTTSRSSSRRSCATPCCSKSSASAGDVYEYVARLDRAVG